MNPEFQRNLWLEASPRRIAWAGVVLALVFGAVAFVTANEGGGTARALGATGMFVFVICALLWGARAAGTAVLAEIADRTWDFQRLSALTPWAMTWGKLFGATGLAWMCGLAGMLVLILSALADGRADRSWTLAFILALAVLVQAISMAAALIGVRKARAEGRVARSGGVVGGLIVGFLLLSSIASSSGFQHGLGTAGLGELFSSNGEVRWWGLVLPNDAFRAIAVAAFAAWALAGAWRLMRLELQMQNAPLVWPAFLAFLAAFTAGFMIDGGLSNGLLAGAMAVALCAYAAGFAEPADRVRLRQFAGALKRGELDRASPMTPATLPPVILAALLVIAGLASAEPTRLGPTLEAGQAMALIAFMCRDLGVVAFFRFGPRPQRGDFGAVVALALLYGIGMLIGGSAGGPAGRALFAPTGEAPFASVISGAMQAAVAWFLAARRIRAPEPSAVSSAPSAPASSPAS